MNRKHLLGLVSAAALMVAGSANAASMWLEASSASVSPGDSLTVSLWGNFDGDGSFTSGGRITLNWDTGLLNLPEPATSTINDADTIEWVWPNLNPIFDGFANRVLDGNYAGGSVEAAFGTSASGFGADCPDAVCSVFGPPLATGDIEFIRFTFEVLGGAGEALTTIGLMGDVRTLDLAGNDGPGASFMGVDVDVASAVIPLPAAAWLMLGGLGALFGFRRNA